MRRTIPEAAPRRGRPKTGAVSAAAALAVVAGLLQFTSAPAVAAGAGDMPSVTLPGAHREAPRRAYMVAADDSGYLSVPNGNSVRWIGRDGSARVTNYDSERVYNGGLGLEKIPQTPPTRNVYEIRRYATGKVTRFTLAAGDRSTGVFAENRLLVSRKVAGKWTLHLLEVPASGGQPVDRTVTGVADDFNPPSPLSSGATSDERGGMFEYTTDDGKYTRYTVLLDFATASLTYVPRAGSYFSQVPRLAGDKVNFYAYDEVARTFRLYVVDREHPEVPGRLLDVQQDQAGDARTIGDWVVYHGGAKDGILAVPITGGPARTLLAASYGGFVDAGDGSFLVAGGTDAEHWAVQHLTLGSDGAPVVKPMSPLPPVSVYEAGGVAVDQGRVLLGTERKDGFQPYLSTDLTATALTLSAGGTLTAAPPQNLGDLGYDESSPTYHVNCYDECLRFTGTGEGTVPHPEEWLSGIVAASGPYTVTQESVNDKYVSKGKEVLASGTWPAATLWGDTLWTAAKDSRGKPVFDRFSLPSMRKLGSLPSTGSCLPSDLQVVGRYVYWSCGPDKQAVVYDQVKRTTQNVPKGYARLADGYLVSQDDKAGKLLITYLKGAVPAARVGTKELAPLPSPLYAPADRRGRFWNVDRFGGPVAYLTASGDVTVKWPKVTASPLAATAATVPTSIDLRQGGTFDGVWHLSQPVATWKLTVTTTAGAVVRTFTGGRAHGKIAVTWDRRAENGTQVRAGTYRVTLTARTANGTPRNAVIYDKPLTVRPVDRHDFGRDGIGDLLAFDGGDHLTIQPGTGSGTFDSANKVVDDSWYRWSAFVPFGDPSGDACNGVLVRDLAGQLDRYDGTCGKAFTLNGPHHAVGTGFNQYDVLTSPGDLTGDGLADLVARDKAGVLWRYSSDGDGGLTERVELVGGLGGYTRLIGAGDLNRDGIGDMVGLDSAGALWRWLGDGKGGFGPRARIAGGISVKALAVPGDLTGDGRPDLVGLDSAGALWRWNGTATATFGTKTRVATGWTGYKNLY
ncbi:FG-GAP-like repeat-containing protein [Streptomyces turgidiscabies]|uniref:FG-GAP-like repeat-containing protein n=1 Tax=Streptomyces TaxID=1883 RepID=UPI001319F2D0|nr:MULTISPECIES: FG-GAP-like repeat-containing protein [Streptomyces]MDX3492880.1 FlgD immunoglobulin-like domain containing protein [Streptomyces turgidiscabies]